jgi:NADH-quinone oxidoreductase subunit L
MFDLVWLIPLFPLLGLLVNALTGWKNAGDRPGLIASAAVGLSFVTALLLFFELLRLPAAERLVEVHLFRWITTAAFSTEMGFQIDPLSMVMILVVTGVSFIIHIYAIGYMHGDRGFNRFFIFLNLFVFAMLILVTANNFLMMFIGWEGVGLCSYLLIGFWYEDDYNAFAGRKAFIVNRIGDFGFLLAIFLIFATFRTLDFTEVFSKAAALPMGAGVLTAIGLLLFVGAAGKSAQLPIYIWLPDAMAGPTPVSALIHAATMVTAGVYMVARANIIYTLAPAAATVVAVVGALTALYAATIGLTQYDIKRVLAYSTISQLGYMFIGVGVGAFAAGIFHLMTHAFFKALLFMAAGSVMHAMSNQTDMRIMGGLKEKMPYTFWTMLIGTLAIAGIPGFSGFFSKDEILWQAWSGVHGAPWLWLIGTLAAALTTFYMFRLIFMTFFGTLRADEKTAHHVHESPGVMVWPLVVLAVLSLVGGYVGIPAVLGGGNHFEHFLAPVFAASEEVHRAAVHGESGAHGLELLLMGIVLLLVLASLWLAWQFYGRKSDLPDKTARSLKGIYTLVFNKYYVDELYDTIIARPLRRLSETALWRFIDTRIIDGSINGVAALVGAGARALSAAHTGFVQNYALVFVLGVIALLFYLFI